MKRLDNEILIEQAQKGDTAAIERLMSAYKNRVKRLARAYFLVGGDNDDLIQEGMIGLFKAIKDYDAQKGSFAAFADLCVTRNMQTAIKKAQRLKHRPLNESLSLDSDSDENDGLINYIIDQTAQDPLYILLKAEQAQSLKELIETKLTDLEKKALKLYLEGLSYNEIAQKIQKSAKSVDNTLQRIKSKLKVLG
ncbi:MAG TPA: sigma-70 family RNA polymerase sigma factor [Clostridiales bacterium]|jgi:RNA polymerase sporulation-specific sigma factor|nr:sigma-70 family RNA polymerase sigma factor [Clostridiales bacterium]